MVSLLGLLFNMKDFPSFVSNVVLSAMVRRDV
jgi:hypothetical protein